MKMYEFVEWKNLMGYKSQQQLNLFQAIINYINYNSVS